MLTLTTCCVVALPMRAGGRLAGALQRRSGSGRGAAHPPVIGSTHELPGAARRHCHRGEAFQGRQALAVRC